jgi:hypothetical protein
MKELGLTFLPFISFAKSELHIQPSERIAYIDSFYPHGVKNCTEPHPGMRRGFGSHILGLVLKDELLADAQLALVCSTSESMNAFLRRQHFTKMQFPPDLHYRMLSPSHMQSPDPSIPGSNFAA